MRNARSNGELNKLAPADHAAHEWYRFVRSFPPHLQLRPALRAAVLEHPRASARGDLSLLGLRLD
jgi:hypothetical protein